MSARLDEREQIVRERRCILKMVSEPEEKLVRMVMGPEGVLVPDVAARLPGRGLWVTADGALIRSALESGQFVKAVSRSLKTGVQRQAVPADLAEQIDRLLARRCLDRLGLENRAGHVLTGFDKIKSALAAKKRPDIAFILAASDGADDGRKKVKSMVGANVPVASLFDREELSKALGRENVVHVLLLQSGGMEKLKADISRLLGMRGIMMPLTCEAQGNEG